MREEVFRRLLAGSQTRQSAFALSRQGRQGCVLLGKALRMTRDRNAARDSAFYLSMAGTNAEVALDDLVASLHRDWQNTRHCVLSAILNVAQEHPEAVAPYLPAIQEYRSDRSLDIQRYVIRIGEAVGEREKDSATPSPPNAGATRQTDDRR